MMAMTPGPRRTGTVTTTSTQQEQEPRARFVVRTLVEVPDRTGARAGSEREVRPASHGISLSRYAWVSIGSSVFLLVLWTVLTNTGTINSTTLPTPQVIVRSFWDFFTVGYAETSGWENIRMSVFRAMVGLGIGLAAGMPLGLLMGFIPLVNALLKPVVSFLRPIPALAFIPLVVLFFGIGEEAKIAVISLASFLYAILHSSAGAAAVPENYLLLGRNLGLSQWRLFWRIVLPAASPYIAAGVRTATAIAWAVMVAAELIAANSGIGWMISDAAIFYRLPYVYVGIILIGVIGLLLEVCITVLEKRIIHWAGKD